MEVVGGASSSGPVNQTCRSSAGSLSSACQVDKHGCTVKEELKSELYYSSTPCQVAFRVLHYANLQSGWSYRNRVIISP